MNAPRIGDVVHYTGGSDANQESYCCAAIVTAGSDPISVAVFSHSGATLRLGTVHYDPDAYTFGDNTPGSTSTEEWISAGPNGFIPGTWHHIH